MLKRAVEFYVKNLLVMFGLAMPLAAVLFGIWEAAAAEPARPVTEAIEEQFQALYLLVWPLMVFITLVHGAWMHGRSVLTPTIGYPGRVWTAAAVAAGVALVLAVGQDYEFVPALLGIVQFASLGAVYGLLTGLLVRLPNPAEPPSRRAV